MNVHQIYNKEVAQCWNLETNLNLRNGLSIVEKENAILSSKTQQTIYRLTNYNYEHQAVLKHDFCLSNFDSFCNP